MRRVGIIICFTLFVFKPSLSKAQSYEAQQLLLDVEKLLQLKNILSDLYKGYEIVSQGYNAIKNVSEGSFNIHKVFLDGLLAVSPAVQKYKRVADIISYQLTIVKEYKTAFNHFKQSGNFTEAEISYISRVYTNLFNESLQNLDDLLNVLTAGKMRMSDDERFAAIDKIFDRISDQVDFLRSFNNSTSILSIQREKEKQDIDVSRKLFDISK